ncbi:XRE family transcriptional regulator [Streptomyces sp. NPDC007094]|uniref:XRE family transcriptional regulator n=1 Tax=Streptomyces sp. NPDC007094 TaxID=3155359 RepID=UPI00340D292E
MKESKRRTTPAPSHESPRPADDFGAWLAQRLTALGYDLSGPRSGGKSRFAEDSGISPSTVGRLLRNEMPTDPRLLRTLAEAIREPYPVVLVRAGFITAEELAGARAPETKQPITPDQAADELGIDDPVERHLFLTMTRTMVRPTPTDGEGRLAD